MKNTKHTENLDNSTPQEITSQSKRKILTSIGVSSGILGASALSQQWTKPIVNSIILPAHAQTTDMMTSTGAPGTGDGDGMGDGTTTTTTPEMDAMGPAIVLSPSEGGVVRAGAQTILVRLSMEPTGAVTVTATGGGVTPGTDDTVEFTTTNWMSDQKIIVAAANPETFDDPDDEVESTVTLTATGADYAGVEAKWKYTVGYYDTADVPAARPTKPMAEGGVGTIRISWTEPVTRANHARYIVEIDSSASAPGAHADANPTNSKTLKRVDASKTDVMFGGTGGDKLDAGDYSYRITAVYLNGSGADTFAAITREGNDAVTVTDVDN